ncbi:MAG: hypothetical protein Q9219_000648 [cf. Caloplaca sp. 3 TL-2023]
MGKSDECPRWVQAQDVQKQNMTLRASRNKQSGLTDLNDLRSQLLEAFQEEESIISNVRKEDWTDEGSSEDRNVPSTDDHSRDYRFGEGNLDPTIFAAGETLYVEVDEEGISRGAHKDIMRWLNGLPEKAVTMHGEVGKVSVATFNLQDYDRNLSDGPAKLDEVDRILSRRGNSMFRERLDGPWELRRPSEVRAEARAGKGSPMSWRSAERLRRFRQGSNGVDWKVVDELRHFSFGFAQRRRKVRRPDLRPMSPMAKVSSS